MATIIKLPTRGFGVSSLFDWAKEVASRAILNGRLIEDIAADTTGVVVDHKMGKVPRGAIVVKSSTSVSYSATSFNSTSFTITASAGTPTVSVWVF